MNIYINYNRTSSPSFLNLVNVLFLCFCLSVLVQLIGLKDSCLDACKTRCSRTYTVEQMTQWHSVSCECRNAVTARRGIDQWWRYVLLISCQLCDQETCDGSFQLNISWSWHPWFATGEDGTRQREEGRYWKGLLWPYKDYDSRVQKVRNMRPKLDFINSWTFTQLYAVWFPAGNYDGLYLSLYGL